MKVKFLKKPNGTAYRAGEVLDVKEDLAKKFIDAGAAVAAGKDEPEAPVKKK